MYARNPHELTRGLEVMNILTNAELIIQACLGRKAGAKELHFSRLDYPEMDPAGWHKFITVRRENDRVKVGEMAIDYYGDLKENYEDHNKEYSGGQSG